MTDFHDPSNAVTLTDNLELPQSKSVILSDRTGTPGRFASSPATDGYRRMILLAEIAEDYPDADGYRRLSTGFSNNCRNEPKPINRKEEKMKTITTLILSAILLVSCTKQNPESPASTENGKIVKQYFEHFNQHDWKKVAEMYTPVADFKDPSLGQGIVKQTRQQIIEKYSGFGDMFPDLKAEVVQIYPSGNNHISVEFITTGTAPDSSKFVLPVCTVFTIENGQIAKDFSYYDNVQ